MGDKLSYPSSSLGVTRLRVNSQEPLVHSSLRQVTDCIVPFYIYAVRGKKIHFFEL